MQYLKAACGFVCFLILASNIWSMSHWTEARGVYDDFCYLRQAHLFQKNGLGGLDTRVSGDDDHYLSTKMKEINLAGWADPITPPCHILMPASQRLVIQYPPGTGFVMALFPQGYQVIPLFVLATVAIFGFGLLAIACATTTLSILLAATFADVAVYLMINPTKASYSMAPTMVVCALVGFLTARLFVKAPQRRGIFLTMLIGFLLGLAVNFRVANLFLSAGYFLFFLVAFLRARNLETLIRGGLFGAALLAGMVPTLIANAINAGSPFKTTYGGADVVPPNFDSAVLWSYVTDIQFLLLVLAGVWTVLILRSRGGNGVRQVALVTAANLLVNLAFFMSHPIFTQYYTIPIAVLSLWSLLFASLMQPAEAGDDDLVGQAVKA
jgi:uncharacterized membrane protein YeaQ/YmgE (transglycosylase-associated protein family)